MTKLLQPLIALSKIEQLVLLEPALIILALVVIAWFVLKLFPPVFNSDRILLLQGLMRNLLGNCALFVITFGLYYALQMMDLEQNALLKSVAAYSGLAALLLGSLAFVKVSRVLLFEYLFLSHSRVAVPVLLVNIFKFALS